MTQKYDFHTIENKWRATWQAIDLYKTGEDPDKPNIYILDYFPYPSGEGLSVGHCRNYVPSCIAARYKRMTGYNVLHPMGWDAFGLPAENYAIAHHIHPRESTARFAANYKRQMQLVECSYDWAREINSTDPDYYRWTQWFFLLLFRRGLAYRAMSSQWWCDQCQTILANEQVEHGRCWRCDSPVNKRDLMQWHFKITAYADRLIADLDRVNWPERIKTMQRNWIGRSEGAEIIFTVQTSDFSKKSDVYAITTFTTRPDTLFGVTFLALAPEHPLVGEIVTEAQHTAVANFIQSTRRLSEIERQSTERAKTGVFTGAYARHPFTGEPIPIWVADYVLPGYGSGAVMGVPAHDERDFAFAQTYNLRITNVIEPIDAAQSEAGCFTGYGRLTNSGPYTDMDSAAAIASITNDLAAQGKGQSQVTYRLRDWLISRQRYWGAPIPIIHCLDCGPVAVPESDLPVLLPEMDDFAPAGDGRSPLARASDWVNTTCPQCGRPAQRETDTMDGFACSSWYFLRFASPHEAARPFDPAAVARWLPVDTYIGGAEHAVMHLLYARFWTKVMADAGLIDFVEPFSELKNQGMLHSAVDGQKMSKSKGNVVTPDEVIARHGTDALRLYVVFLGPFDADVMWDDVGIRGMTRFLERFWRLANESMAVAGVPTEPHRARSGDRPEQMESEFNAEAQRRREEFERERHRVIKRVTADMEGYRFNTAVAALMEFLNYLHDHRDAPAEQWQAALESFAILLAPFAPFITEEVWQAVWGHTDSIHRQNWPVYDEALTTAVTIRMAVQINGKVRDHITIPAGTVEAEIQQLAVNQVQRYVNGRTPQNIIVVPGRLVNIVV